MLHIDLDTAELTRMNSYLYEMKQEKRKSSSEVAVEERDSQNSTNPPSQPSPVPLSADQLEELLSKLDLTGASEDEDEDEHWVSKTGDVFSQGTDRRESYERLRQKNERKARELNFRFEESGFDGGLFLDGITLTKLEEGVRHLRRLKRFLDIVRQVERQMKVNDLSNEPVHSFPQILPHGVQSNIQPVVQTLPQPIVQTAPQPLPQTVAQPIPQTMPHTMMPPMMQQSIHRERQAYHSFPTASSSMPTHHHEHFGGAFASHSGFSNQPVITSEFTSYNGSQSTGNPEFSSYGGQVVASSEYSDFNGQAARNSEFTSYSSQTVVASDHSSFLSQSISRTDYFDDLEPDLMEALGCT